MFKNKFESRKSTNVSQVNVPAVSSQNINKGRGQRSDNKKPPNNIVGNEDIKIANRADSQKVFYGNYRSSKLNSQTYYNTENTSKILPPSLVSKENGWEDDIEARNFTSKSMELNVTKNVASIIEKDADLSVNVLIGNYDRNDEEIKSNESSLWSNTRDKTEKQSSFILQDMRNEQIQSFKVPVSFHLCQEAKNSIEKDDSFSKSIESNEANRNSLIDKNEDLSAGQILQNNFDSKNSKNNESLITSVDNLLENQSNYSSSFLKDSHKLKNLRQPLKKYPFSNMGKNSREYINRNDEVSKSISDINESKKLKIPRQFSEESFISNSWESSLTQLDNTQAANKLSRILNSSMNDWNSVNFPVMCYPVFFDTLDLKSNLLSPTSKIVLSNNNKKLSSFYKNNVVLNTSSMSLPFYNTLKKDRAYQAYISNLIDKFLLSSTKSSNSKIKRKNACTNDSDHDFTAVKTSKYERKNDCTNDNDHYPSAVQSTKGEYENTCIRCEICATEMNSPFNKKSKHQKGFMNTRDSKRMSHQSLVCHKRICENDSDLFNKSNLSNISKKDSFSDDFKISKRVVKDRSVNLFLIILKDLFLDSMEALLSCF